MSQTIFIPPEIDVQVAGAAVDPFPPQIVAISQANGTIVVGIQQNRVTGSYPIVAFQLFRGETSLGPFVQVDTELVSIFLLTTNAFDINPNIGIERFYTAKSVDVNGTVSALATPVSYTAYGQLLTTGAPQVNISAAALGPYPLLGSDIFLDPATGEGVVGPNGDLMTINGLDCLAQDLRMRLQCALGDLCLHPNWGMARSGGIGSGQAAPQVEAQILRTRVVEVVSQDPRVQAVTQVSVTNPQSDGWVISYTVMAIGVEDPQRLNLVVPYFFS